MKKAIVLVGFNRPSLLEESINSIVGASGSQNWIKILIAQRGNDAIELLITKYRNEFDLVISTDGNQGTALANINFNRILGTRIAFDTYRSDFVLGIEEDTQIGFDSLNFIDNMCKKYGQNISFRGVNLGSLEDKTENDLTDYSRIRYGIHGQAGGITRRSWKKIDALLSGKELSKEGWDARIEAYLKSGFMATPNVSRMRDDGWDNGTHAPSNKEDPHYMKLRQNWVGVAPFSLPEYQNRDIFHSWRKDSIVFKPISNFYFYLKQTEFSKKIISFKTTHLN